jgi:hypothetical protein
MQRTTAPNNVASKPAYVSGGESPGWHTDEVTGGSGTPGTLVSAAQMNLIQDEICNAIEDVGLLSLSSADDTQLAQTLAQFQGTFAKTSGITAVKSTAKHNAAVASDEVLVADSFAATVASHNSSAAGTKSAVIACTTMKTSAAQTAAIASEGTGSASGTLDHEVGTPHSAVIASGFSETTDTATAGVEYCAVIACHKCDTDGFQTAVIASSDAGGSRCVARGESSAVIASIDGCGTSDIKEAQAVIASSGSSTAEDRAAVVSGSGSYASGAGSICLGGLNVEVGTAGMIGGGDNSGSGAITPSGSNQGLTWTISKSGVGTFLTLALTAVPAGATQGGVGVGAGQLWRTASHATLPDNVLMVGV